MCQQEGLVGSFYRSPCEDYQELPTLQGGTHSVGETSAFQHHVACQAVLILEGTKTHNERHDDRERQESQCARARPLSNRANHWQHQRKGILRRQARKNLWLYFRCLSSQSGHTDDEGKYKLQAHRYQISNSHHVGRERVAKEKRRRSSESRTKDQIACTW